MLGDHLFCPKPPPPWTVQTGSGSGEKEAANPGQQEVSVFSTATKGTGREPCGLGSQLLEKASSQFQLSWGQELLRPAALHGGCYLLACEHPVAVATLRRTRQEPATRPGAEPSLL